MMTPMYPPISSSTFNWPAPQDVVIASPQSSDQAGVFTGNFPYIYPSECGYDRTFRLISGIWDNSGINFTFTGYESSTGELITEVISNVVRGSVIETSKSYTQLISVEADGPFKDIGVTLGGYGTVWVPLDPTLNVFNVSILTSLNGKNEDAGVVYDILSTNSPVQIQSNVISNIEDLIPTLFSLNSLDSSTGNSITVPAISLPTHNSELLRYTTPSTLLVFLMGAGNTNVNTSSSIFISVLQQGRLP